MSESLNEAQRKAVMHGEGPMLVLAGPGSGKTTVITNRISYLIKHFGVDPCNILVITFTKDAALNMKNRFFSAGFASYPVNFGTFHAIFYHMLLSSGYCQADAVLTNSEKKRYMIPILIDYNKENGHNTDSKEQLEEDVFKCLAAIGFYKNTDDRKKAVQMLETPYDVGFSQIFEKYELQRKKCRRLDFDDMLYLCQKMLEENPGILKCWQERYTYLLVDEYQDINPRQNSIMKLLAGDRQNLFVVGDDDQSIYGFRGAVPSLMKQFKEDYPNCEQVLLNLNYRSKPKIIEASRKVIRENKERFPKELKSAFYCDVISLLGQDVVLKGFTEKSLQYQFLVEQFRNSTDRELHETAVLFRTNLQMQGFAAVIRKAGIPYRMKEKAKGIYDHFVAKDIRNYILFACGDNRRSLFLTIMNKPYRWISREMLEEETVSFETIRACCRKYLNAEESSRCLLLLGELEDGLLRVRSLSPYLGLQYLRRRMGYEAYLTKKAGSDRRKLDEWLEILDILSMEASGFECYEKWMEYQTACQTEQGVKSVQEQEEGIQLMTVHASKGLEFEQVWIPDLNEGIYPHGRLPSKEVVEEERRILYVAMTRAKKSLGLTYVTGTKESPRLVSRFLEPLLR